MSSPLRAIRHLLIDLDGVLYLGNSAIPGAVEFVGWLRARRLSFRLVTNNATLTPEQYVAKLGAMGIPVLPEEAFTSALATAQYLQTQGAAGQGACAIGEEGLEQALTAIDLRLDAPHPEWVVVGLDRLLTYDKLKRAALAIGAGARFIGTNPDTSLPTEEGLLPGAGSILAALTATTGVAPLVIGKPEPTMLQLAMTALVGTLENTAMLGDRLDTDIAGAARIGMPSIMVLTGVSNRADLETSPVQPTLVMKDLFELIAAWPPEDSA